MSIAAITAAAVVDYVPNATVTAIVNDAEIVSDIIIMPSTTKGTKSFDTVENIKELKQKFEFINEKYFKIKISTTTVVKREFDKKVLDYLKNKTTIDNKLRFNIKKAKRTCN